MAGHVREEHTQPLFVNLEEVVEVAGHCGQRTIARRDRHTREVRHRLRQNRGLDLTRHTELSVDHDQPARIVEHALDGERPEADDEYR